jgi:hypothetical protein
MLTLMVKTFLRDPDAGVPNWVSVNHPEYWSYLTMFCKNTDKYQVIEKPKKLLKCKIGDCFYVKDCVGDVSLIKIINIEDHGWFYCREISVGKNDIDYYDVSYHIDDTSDWVPINASLYENVLTLVNAREDAVAKVIEQFDNQIRKLCQEVNQNQENK